MKFAYITNLIYICTNTMGYNVTQSISRGRLQTICCISRWSCLSVKLLVQTLTIFKCVTFTVTYRAPNSPATDLGFVHIISNTSTPATTTLQPQPTQVWTPTIFITTIHCKLTKNTITINLSAPCAQKCFFKKILRHICGEGKVNLRASSNHVRTWFMQQLRLHARASAQSIIL